MGVLLKWKRVTSEASYNQVRVHRATSETGDYSIIASQTIEDTSYYDPEGNSTFWYKVQFVDTVSGNASQLSNPVQGSTFYGYCTVDEVRQLTNIKTSDISDTNLATIIEFSCGQLNADMNVYHEMERIDYIDEVKSNQIDGVNTTFYLKKYPIGDSNNDFTVTTADVKVYSRSAGVDTLMTITSVDLETGKIVLETAPSGTQLFATYFSCARKISPPVPLVKFACIMLTASWAYSKLNVGKATRFHMGNLTVFRDMDSHETYYKKYMRLLTLINDRTIADTIEVTNLI